MPNLSQLNLGPGSYGYTPDLFRSFAIFCLSLLCKSSFYRTCFLAGLVDMRRLTHFTLQFDCFDQLIEVEWSSQKMISHGNRMDRRGLKPSDDDVNSKGDGLS